MKPSSHNKIPLRQQSWQETNWSKNPACRRWICYCKHDCNWMIARRTHISFSKPYDMRLVTATLTSVASAAFAPDIIIGNAPPVMHGNPCLQNPPSRLYESKQCSTQNRRST